MLCKRLSDCKKFPLKCTQNASKVQQNQVGIHVKHEDWKNP